MLLAVLKIEMKRTCLFPVCFQLSLSCLSLHSGDLHVKTNPRKISAVRRAQPDEFGIGSSFPKWGHALCGARGASGCALPTSGHCPCRLRPAAVGPALTLLWSWPLSLGVWPSAAPCVLPLGTLLTVPSGSVGSEQRWQSCAPAQAGSARVLPPQKPWAKSPCSHLFCWRYFSRCLWHIPPACTACTHSQVFLPASFNWENFASNLSPAHSKAMVISDFRD